MFLFFNELNFLNTENLLLKLLLKSKFMVIPNLINIK